MPLLSTGGPVHGVAVLATSPRSVIVSFAFFFPAL